MGNRVSGWRIARIHEVLEELTERRGEQENLPVLSITKNHGIMLAAERFDRAINRNLRNYRIAPRDSIALDPMLLWSGTIGRQKVVDAGIVSQDYRVYRVLDAATPEFLEYAFKGHQMTSQFKLAARGTNVRRNRISRSDFLGLQLTVPPLAEQRKIAAILGAVDQAIDKTQAVIDQVQVVKKALMQDLLTRGLPGRHTRFKQTDIGELPESWSVAPLSAVAFVQTGLAKNKKNEGHIEVPYLRVANVQDGYLDLSEMKTVRVSELAMDRYGLQDDDVLFTEGGDADKLGRGTVWRGQIRPCLHQNHVFAVRTDRRRLVPDFLSLYGGSSRGKAYFLESAKQTTNLASINSSQLKAMPVPIPPVEEQYDIVKSVTHIGERANAEQRKLAALQTLKQSLMSVLLTGEVRVPLEPTP